MQLAAVWTKTVPLVTTDCSGPGWACQPLLAPGLQNQALDVERRLFAVGDDRDRRIGRALGQIGALDVAFGRGGRRGAGQDQCRARSLAAAIGTDACALHHSPILGREWLEPSGYSAVPLVCVVRRAVDVRRRVQHADRDAVRKEAHLPRRVGVVLVRPQRVEFGGVHLFDVGLALARRRCRWTTPRRRSRRSFPARVAGGARTRRRARSNPARSPVMSKTLPTASRSPSPASRITRSKSSGSNPNGPLLLIYPVCH